MRRDIFHVAPWLGRSLGQIGWPGHFTWKLTSAPVFLTAIHLTNSVDNREVLQAHSTSNNNLQPYLAIIATMASMTSQLTARIQEAVSSVPLAHRLWLTKDNSVESKKASRVHIAQTMSSILNLHPLERSWLSPSTVPIDKFKSVKVWSWRDFRSLSVLLPKIGRIR